MEPLRILKGKPGNLGMRKESLVASNAACDMTAGYRVELPKKAVREWRL
jgi:hypothetical protein